MVRGGIKIEVESKRVNQYQNEEERDWYDWNPEFVGDHLRSDLVNWVTALERIQMGDVDRYKRVRVDIEAMNAYFLLEPISESHLRVAFRARSREEDDPIPPTANSARGYVVRTEQLSNEILDCGREFLEQTLQLGFFRTQPQLAAFSEMVDDFEALVAS